MGKTLAEIRTIVRFRGDFRNAIRFPNANVDTEIQAAFGEFYEIVVDANEGYYDTSADVTTTAGVAFVALPSGTWRVRGVDRMDGVDPTPMRRIGVSERTWWNSNQDEPVAYRLTARGIDLFPTPNAVYTLRVTYTPVAPTLDGTSREFYNGWEEYTIFGALVRLAGNERTDVGRWQEQCDRQRARVAAAAANRNSAEPELLPLWGTDEYDRDQRWR